MRVALFPGPDPDKPSAFVTLLACALSEAGGEPLARRPFNLRFVLSGTPVDVVHLHWLEYLATPDRKPAIGWVRSWLKAARLLAVLALLRRRGVGVIWTVHNLRPHEPIRPSVEDALAQAVALLADEIIVHSEYAAGRVRAQFRGRAARAPAVIPHANYERAFPASRQSREKVRHDLGLPREAFVYLAFGVIRRYKRLGFLAEQFHALRDPNVYLLVAGAPNQADEVERVRALSETDPRIVLRAGYVGDDQVSALHLAADAAVLAYEDVFSSGALLLALTQGLPVVAPAGGTAQELFAPPAAEFFDGEDLLPALARVRTGDRTVAARTAAQRFPWRDAGVATVGVYERARARRTRSRR